MISTSVDDQRVQGVFKLMIEKAQNPGGVTPALAARMLAAIEDNFRAEGRPQKWKALKPSTLAARAAAGKSGKILQATGKLAASMTPFYGANYAGVGTNRPYAAAMNNGSKPHIIQAKNKKALKVNGRFFRRVKHPGTVPRPFMVLMDQDKSDLLQIMGRHLMAEGQLSAAEALSWGIR